MTRILPALRALLFALVVLGAALNSGCGLKGDLVLPDPADASSAPAPQQDADEEGQDADERQR